jgi:hypothetical protein
MGMAQLHYEAGLTIRFIANRFLVAVADSGPQCKRHDANEPHHLNGTPIRFTMVPYPAAKTQATAAVELLLFSHSCVATVLRIASWIVVASSSRSVFPPSTSTVPT